MRLTFMIQRGKEYKSRSALSYEMCEAAAPAPPKEADALEKTSPVVRLRKALGGPTGGWHLDAQRSVKSDQRSRTSTLVSAHRPGEHAAEWVLEHGTEGFRLRLGSEHLSQPSGWYLDVDADGAVVVRKGNSTPAAEWLIDFEGQSPGVAHMFSLQVASPGAFCGWFLDTSESSRTDDSVYLRLVPELSFWLLELQKFEGASADLFKRKAPLRLYEVVVRNFSDRPLLLQGKKAPALRKVAKGKLLQISDVLSPEPGPDAETAALGPGDPRCSRWTPNTKQGTCQCQAPEEKCSRIVDKMGHFQYFGGCLDKLSRVNQDARRWPG
ncbi:unnamed protein product [Effrenium voratum]|nr:unnamed protein product [Effrenium voratum]